MALRARYAFAIALFACKSNEITVNNGESPDAAAVDAPVDATPDPCAVSPLPLQAAKITINPGASFAGHTIPTVDAFAYVQTDKIGGTGPDGGMPVTYNQTFDIYFASSQNACADALAGVLRQDQDDFFVGVVVASDAPGTIPPGTYSAGSAFVAQGADGGAAGLGGGWTSYSGKGCAGTSVGPQSTSPVGVQFTILSIDANHVTGTFDGVDGQEEGKGTFDLPICPVRPPVTNAMPPTSVTCCPPN
jgi:hypothetical protein